GFKLMENVWKRPEQYAGREPVVNSPRFVGATATTVLLTGVPAGPANSNLVAERDAIMKLDKIKVKLRAGKPYDAKSELAELIKSYPDTSAATEAKQLLAGQH